jgi:hypothetical protein
LRATTSGQTCSQATGPPRTLSTSRIAPGAPRPRVDLARPETHQNLIHSNKEPAPRNPASQPDTRKRKRHRHRVRTNTRTVPNSTASLRYSRHPALTNPPVAPKAPTRTRTSRSEGWWRRSGSNRRPPACKAGALPAELRPPTPGPTTTRNTTIQPATAEPDQKATLGGPGRI